MFKLEISANSLEELWSTLSALRPPAAPAKAVDTASTLNEVETAEASTPPVKRGPGRPPGSGNKNKPSSLPPAFVRSVKADPEEVETEAEEPEDADDAPTEAVDASITDEDDDETRAMITQELGRFWKQSSSMKQKIQAFRSELGISTMLDLSPADFPKAKAFLAKLAAEASAP
jgi:hypothetical protein